MIAQNENIRESELQDGSGIDFLFWNRISPSIHLHLHEPYYYSLAIWCVWSLHLWTASSADKYESTEQPLFIDFIRFERSFGNFQEEELEWALGLDFHLW